MAEAGGVGDQNEQAPQGVHGRQKPAFPFSPIPSHSQRVKSTLVRTTELFGKALAAITALGVIFGASLWYAKGAEWSLYRTALWTAVAIVVAFALLFGAVFLRRRLTNRSPIAGLSIEESEAFLLAIQPLLDGDRPSIRNKSALTAGVACICLGIRKMDGLAEHVAYRTKQLGSEFFREYKFHWHGLKQLELRAARLADETDRLMKACKPVTDASTIIDDVARVKRRN